MIVKILTIMVLFDSKSTRKDAKNIPKTLLHIEDLIYPDTC